MVWIKRESQFDDTHTHKCVQLFMLEPFVDSYLFVEVFEPLFFFKHIFTLH